MAQRVTSEELKAAVLPFCSHLVPLCVTDSVFGCLFRGRRFDSSMLSVWMVLARSLRIILALSVLSTVSHDA